MTRVDRHEGIALPEVRWTLRWEPPTEEELEESVDVAQTPLKFTTVGRVWLGHGRKEEGVRDNPRVGTGLR